MNYPGLYTRLVNRMASEPKRWHIVAHEVLPSQVPNWRKSLREAAKKRGGGRIETETRNENGARQVRARWVPASERRRSSR